MPRQPRQHYTYNSMVRRSLVVFTNSTRDSATIVLSDGSVLVAREKVGSSRG
jgi:hypothetical protein